MQFPTKVAAAVTACGAIAAIALATTAGAATVPTAPTPPAPAPTTSPTPVPAPTPTTTTIRVLVASLTGAKAVPLGDALGRATFEARLREHSICYRLRVRRLASPTSAAIGLGIAGTNGPVATPLALPASGESTVHACQAVDPLLARALRRSAKAFYVSVGTSAFPGGAVRGQLHWETRIVPIGADEGFIGGD